MNETTPPQLPTGLGAAQRPSTQRVIPITSRNFIPASQLETVREWSRVFGRTAPLALEIGCGTGHFVLQLADRHPETDFLAIDIYNKGCLKTCSKIDTAGLTNVRVLRIEARELLTKSIPDGALQAIYINCPDPWPKKRHRDRRLVNRDFLEAALRRLTPEGDFFFSSDQLDYAEEVASLLGQLPGFVNQLPTPWVEELPGYPLSKYMRRFLDQGLPVYFIHHRRTPGPLPEIQTPDLRRGYRSRRCRGHHD